MYKTTIYTKEDEFTIKTANKVSFYQEEGLGYLVNKSGVEIFAVNITELTAIELNRIDKTKTSDITIDVNAKEMAEKLSDSIKQQIYDEYQRKYQCR